MVKGMKIKTKEIYVVDTETTGLDGYPKDLILEITITKVNLEKQSIEIVYDSVLGYDTKIWDHWLRDAWIFHNSTLKIEDVQKARSSSLIVPEIQEILKGKVVTSFNVEYDFDQFLYHEPFNLKGDVTVPFCLMLLSTNECKLPGYYQEYKWPRLEEAYDILVQNKDPELSLNAHRAKSDTLMASYVLLELFKRKVIQI